MPHTFSPLWLPSQAKYPHAPAALPGFPCPIPLEDPGQGLLLLCSSLQLPVCAPLYEASTSYCSPSTHTHSTLHRMLCIITPHAPAHLWLADTQELPSRVSDTSLCTSRWITTPSQCQIWDGSLTSEEPQHCLGSTGDSQGLFLMGSGATGLQFHLRIWGFTNLELI